MEIEDLFEKPTLRKRFPETKKLYFVQLDIGHFFYDVQLGLFGVKISARCYFDLNNNAIRRLNNRTAMSRKAYYICDYEVW